MRKLILLAIFAGFLSACTDSPVGIDDASQPVVAPSFAKGGKVQAANPVADQYLLMFKGSVPARFESDVEKLGGSVVFVHEVGIAVAAGLSPGAVGDLAEKKYLKSIQPDEVFQLDPMVDLNGVQAVNARVASPGDPTSAAIFARQWNMLAIDADDAWAVGRLGSSSVTVAILDTGIDYNYPDLLGLVDLSRSVSFIPEDDALVDFFFPGMHHVTDLVYHGTHVAATVASNGLVAAGVTSGTTLMGVKVCSVYGGCPFSAVIGGILHAADQGADVANMSLGGGFLKMGMGRYVGFINQVFNYANSRGMTVVVSAGNDGWDLDHFPALYKTYCDAPNTICVSATGPTAGEGLVGPWTEVDAPAPYTNFGRSAINVAAPGGTYLPTSDAGWVWAGCSTTSLVIPACQTGYYIIGMTGTSMAAPHVSGLAALMVEDVGRNPGRIRARIQQSADDLGQRGTDPFYGKGRINVAAAVGG
jgi:subtilisin family serine protease